MPAIKKLAFAPLFLIIFAYLCYQINPFLTSGDSLFSLSLESLLIPLILAGIVLITSFLFVLFATLAQDWKLVGGTILVAGIIPVAFLPSPLNLYMVVGTIISLVLVFALLLNKLKNYLTFQPTVLLYSPIKNLSTLLVLIIAFLYFQSLSATISQKGFEIPDSLIESVLNLSDASATLESGEPSQPQLPKLTKEEIDFLKQNPHLLEERGIDPSIIEQLENPGQTGSEASNRDIIKATVKSQVQGMIKPYEPFIAPTLALLIFFTLTSFISLLSLITPILLWATFSILKSTGYVKFVTEMREVKKLVV